MRISYKILTIALSLTALTSTAFPDDSPKPNQPSQAVLDQLQKLGPKPIETLTPEEARRQPSVADAVKALLQSQGKKTDPEAVAKVKNQEISGPGGPIPIRIYTPEGKGPMPVIVYYHGGGWVIADLDTYDASARALANAAKAIVVSSHYRQAPEHPFPASHEDAFAAYQWARQNAGSFNGDPNRIAVAGESAGGNLAVAVSMMARDQKVPLPVHQVAVYPVAGTNMNTESYQQNAKAKPLNKAMMEWFAKHEFQNPKDMQDQRVNLVHANLRGLPPTTVITAQIDPLRSEGQMLADNLEKAGVHTKYKNYDGVTHEFFGMGAVINEARDAVNLAASDLKESFERQVAEGESVDDKAGAEKP